MSLFKVLNSEVHPMGLKNVLSASYAAADRSGDLTERHLKPIVQRAAEEGQRWARSFLGGEKRAGLIIGRYDASSDLDRMLTDLNANPVEESYVKNQLAMGRSPRARWNHNRTIARTSAMNVYIKAALIEMRDDGLTHARRMEVHDHRTSPICRTLNGTIHEIAKLLTYLYPLTNDSHPNCVLPDTIVSAGCIDNISGGFIAAYKGVIFEIVLSDGRRVSVTPNHMLMTPLGFIRAIDLREGDNVIGCTDRDWTRGCVPNYDHKPSRIQDIINSLPESLGMKTRGMKVSPEDFHGDGVFMDGNVDIILPDSELSGACQSSLNKPIENKLLSERLGVNGDLLGCSPFTQILFGSLHASNGIMGRLRDLKSSMLSKFLHSYSVSLGCRPSINSHFFKDSIYSNFTNSNVSSYFNSTLSGSVSIDNSLIIDGAPSFNDIGLDVSIESCSRDSEIIANFIAGFTGLISNLNIVSINKSFYHGPVYDLQTESSSYFTEGILSSNCRGTFVPHFGLGAYRPQHFDMPTNINIGKFENAPIELSPWLNGLGKIIPFKKVVFEDLGKDQQTRLEKDVLKINLLDEEDPREILLEESARYHWPKVKDNFGEILALRDMRLIQPSKTYHNDWEFFMHLYQDYRLNQLEDPFVIGWFKTNIK